MRALSRGVGGGADKTCSVQKGGWMRRGWEPGGLQEAATAIRGEAMVARTESKGWKNMDETKRC